MSELLFNGASTAKGHPRLDAVEKSLGAGSLRSCPGPFKNVKTIEGLLCYILKLLALVVSDFEIAESPAVANHDDRIKRIRLRVSLKNCR